METGPRFRRRRTAPRPQSPPMGHRSGPPRRTSTPGGRRPASSIRCAGWATSTARARARMGRRAWWPSSATTFGRPTRDYVHVEDVARAIILAIGAGATFNVSTGVETEVTQIFDALQAAAGTSISPELAPLRSGELTRSCMDPSRAASRLGWRPEIGLSAGLKQTYEQLVAGFEARETGTRRA